MSESPQKYEEQIDKWIKLLKQKQDELREHFEQKLIKIYIFIKNIQQKFGFKVLLDNSVGLVLEGKLEQVQNRRFCYQQTANKNLQYFQQQPWNYILYIGETLYQNKFIIKSYYCKIVNSCSANCSVEKQLMDYCNLMEVELEDEQLKYQFKYLQIWKSIINIDYIFFWSKYIHTKPIAMSGSLVMRRLFNIFKNTLSDKFKSNYYNKILSILQIKEKTEIKQNKQNLLHNILNNIANKLWLFNNEKKIQQIQQQLSVFQSILTEKLNKQNKYNKIVFQTYGSYRSQICLDNSDVDLTIFIQGKQQQQHQSRIFIQKNLQFIFGILRKIQKNYNQQLRISDIFAVNNQRIRVPFIRVMFMSQMPLKEMDIVINNHYGVNNSKMLHQYAQNQTIRNVGIILKKWAKVNNLIDPHRMSSYGLILLLLYFLMSIGELQYITKKNMSTCKYDTKLKHKLDSMSVLKTFLQFYSDDYIFNKKKQMVCLIKDCKDHLSLFKQQYIINIHDPFDNTNPGRIKQKDRTYFMCFKNTINNIYTIQKSNIQYQEKLIKKLFQQKQGYYQHHPRIGRRYVQRIPF